VYRIGNHRFISAASILLTAVLGACSSDRNIILPDAAPKTSPAVVVGVGKSRAEGYSMPGERRQGYILNKYGKVQQVTYEVHDGLAIWQGDIVLGRVNEVATTPMNARALAPANTRIGEPTGGVQKTVYITDGGYRWSGGVVPYEVDAALPNQQRITDAIARIEEATGGITFVPRSGQADYVRFVTSTGCSSKIGRQGGQQNINLADDCSTGNATHEMMHALGLDHEMARCDRDNYVVVFIANVASGMEFNFDKECANETDLGSEYDFDSMMQYSLDAFSSNGMNTIGFAPGVTYSGTVGQRDSLSLLDRATLNWLYGPNNKPPVPVIAPFDPSYDEGAPVAMDATGSTDADDKKLTYRWNFGDGSCAAFPQPTECTQSKPNHRYANDGVYKVGLFVYDGYEEKATEAFVTIVNVKPDISFYGGGIPINEGDSLYTGGDFADPGADVWSATVNYGDGGGVKTLPLIGKNFILNHRYADNGSFTVAVDVQDDDATSTKTMVQDVLNVPPKVDAGADRTFTSGQTFNFAGSFSDPGINDAPWNWSIDWGAGTPTTGSKTAQGAITASNRVCGAGTYNVVLSVTDKDAGTGKDTAQVTVGYVVVGLSIMPGSAPSPISLKKQGSLPVAILSSPTFDARTIDVASLRLGNEVGVDAQVAMSKGKYQTGISDANGDGRLDLIVTFNVPDLIANGDLTLATTQLVLRGKQGPNGDPCINFRGVGAVKVN
jgi:PKD repeat protein